MPTTAASGAGDVVSGDTRPRRRPPGRPRGGSTAARRRRIVDAAVEEIATHGYLALTMARVAQAADISPTRLAHHSASKEELLSAVLARRDELDELPTQSVGEGCPFGYLHAQVDLARRNAERAEMVRLFTAMSGAAGNPAHAAHRWLRGHYGFAVDDILGHLRAEQACGRIHPDAPLERIVREMCALMDGYQLQWLLDPEVDMAGLLGAHVADVERRWRIESGGACPAA